MKIRMKRTSLMIMRRILMNMLVADTWIKMMLIDG